MRAAVTNNSGGFDVASLPDPTPKADQLVIRVAACGVCGSDLKAHRFMPVGTVMGHEMCGEVVAVGSEASGWREGTRVAVLPLISCGTCDACLKGEVAHCLSLSAMGMGRDHGGSLSLSPCPRDTPSPYPPNCP